MDGLHHLKIKRAAHCLWQGGVIAYPTEAVWGLGCDPFDEQAVRRLLTIKRRGIDKGLILVAADIHQLESYLRGLSAKQRKKLRSNWPGPLTWLVPDNGYAPKWITGRHKTLALRVSKHPIVESLCLAFGGPIVSTSANPQNKAPALNALAVRQYFRNQLDFITPGSVGGQTKPSEIRELLTGEIKRPG